MNIRYNIVNADKVAEYIKSLPRGIKAAAMRAISEYIIGNGQHGLKHDVAYKYVPRNRIPVATLITYGPLKGKIVRGYFSSKQYYYVTWALRTGRMKIGRKNDPTKYSQSWRWEQKDSKWDRTQVQGKLPFDRFPSRHNMLAGWRHYLEVVQSNMKGAMQEAQRKVDEFIKKGTK